MPDGCNTAAYDGDNTATARTGGKAAKTSSNKEGQKEQKNQGEGVV